PRRAPGAQAVACVGRALATAGAADRVDAAQLRHQGQLVVDVLQVADHQDLVHAPGLEVAGVIVRDAGQVRVDLHVARAGHRRQLGRGQPDDADPFTADPLDVRGHAGAAVGVR